MASEAFRWDVRALKDRFDSERNLIAQKEKGLMLFWPKWGSPFLDLLKAFLVHPGGFRGWASGSRLEDGFLVESNLYTLILCLRIKDLIPLVLHWFPVQGCS